ncbi:hypothetical protein TNCV_643971 [Trichonephila clavipes]|nr:hypothetical protein TNCV_643971 [Trichonephila clavipes]
MTQQPMRVKVLVPISVFMIFDTDMHDQMFQSGVVGNVTWTKSWTSAEQSRYCAQLSCVFGNTCTWICIVLDINSSTVWS